MWLYRPAYGVPLVTLILYICVCGSNFKRESRIHEQTDRLLVHYSIDRLKCIKFKYSMMI